MRKPFKFTFISIACLIVFLTACSFPLLQGGDDEIVIPTLAPEEPETEMEEEAEEDKASPTATTAPPEIVKVDAEWDGVWTIWMGDGAKAYTIDFLVQGEKISGSTVIENGESISFQGTIQEDYASVEGLWEITDGTSGDFSMYISDDLSEFSGRLDSESGLCGVKEGSIKPSTCFE